MPCVPLCLALSFILKGVAEFQPCWPLPCLIIIFTPPIYSDLQLQLTDLVDSVIPDSLLGVGTEAGAPSTGTPVVGNVRSWGLERINQVNLPLVDAYNPGADGSGVHGESRCQVT